MKKQGRSIFHTIFLAMLSVLFIETLLLLIVLYLSRVGERLNHNAIDLLQKQVENRSSYLESVSSTTRIYPLCPTKSIRRGISSGIRLSTWSISETTAMPAFP